MTESHPTAYVELDYGSDMVIDLIDVRNAMVTTPNWYEVFERLLGCEVRIIADKTERVVWATAIPAGDALDHYVFPVNVASS